MKKVVLYFSLILTCFASSCTQQGHKAKAKEEAQKAVAVEAATESPWQLLITNIGQHIPNNELFGIKALNEGLTATIGDQSESLKQDWNVGSPVMRSNNIVSISGCKHDACPESHWLIYVDVADNIMNVYHFQNDKLTIYKGKELLSLPPSMQETLDTMKSNANVTPQTTKVI